jgi:hypothetical protein
MQRKVILLISSMVIVATPLAIATNLLGQVGGGGGATEFVCPHSKATGVFCPLAQTDCATCTTDNLCAICTHTVPYQDDFECIGNQEGKVCIDKTIQPDPEGPFYPVSKVCNKVYECTWYPEEYTPRCRPNMQLPLQDQLKIVKVTDDCP